MLRNIGLSNLPVNFLLIPIERPFLTPHHHAGKKAAFQRALNSRKQPGVFSENFKRRSEEHTSEFQSLMRISYAVFCLKKKKTTQNIHKHNFIMIHIKD